MPIDDTDLGNLPDQITPGDSDANSATTYVLSRLQGWTGSVWKRILLGSQTAANSLSVSLASDQATASAPLRIDPTGSTTQPVSAPGAAALALDATLTGGAQKAIVRGAAKGASVAADGTTTAQGADHQGVDVQVRDTAGNPFPSADVAARKLFAAVTDGTNVLGTPANPLRTDPTGITTQPVSVASLPLPSGASTSALQGTTFDLDSSAGTQNVTGVSLRKTASGGSVELGTSSDPVRTDPTGATTQPISAASLPLPTGAATSANQTTANSSLSSIDGKLASAAVPGDTDSNSAITQVTARLQAWTGSVWQRVRSGAQTSANSVAVTLATDQATAAAPLRVDPTGTTTQPVSAPAGGALALDATLTGGTQKAIIRGAAKGASVAADGTTTAQGADHQGLDVQIRDTSGNPFPSADVAARKLFAAVTDGTNTATVKAASTAAATTDTAVVVAQSPNTVGFVVRRPGTATADSTTYNTSGTAALVQKQDGIKSGAGTFHSFTVYNSSTSPRWIYVYDNTTATGATVIHVEQVPGKNPASGLYGSASTFFEYGRRFATGLSWAASTTAPGTAFSAAGSEIYAETEYV